MGGTGEAKEAGLCKHPDGHFYYIICVPYLGYLLGLSFYNYTTLICFTVTILLLTYCWQEKPAFLRAGLWMAFANWLAYFFCCERGEYRDLYWGMPIIAMLATHTLIRAADIAHLPIFQPIPKAPRS